MSRFSMIATALVIGLLAGGAANAKANSKEKQNRKDKGHKIVGLSPVDFPHKDHNGKNHNGKNHGKDNCDKDNCGKDNCGSDRCNDNCGNDSCHHGSKPTQFYPGGSKNGPPGTPENPTQPVPKTPIKFPPSAYKIYGNKNLAGNPMKGLHDPLQPTKPAPGRPTSPSQGQIPTLGTGFNGFAGAIGKDVGSVVGMGVTQALRGVGSVASAAGDIASGVANAAGDLASGVGNALASLL